MITKQQAALAAILYADIFDYPLTASDLITWSVLRQPTFPKEAVKKGLFVILRGRERLAAVRKKRSEYAGEKLAIAQHVANVLRRIPTIQLVGVTGGLAMNNAQEDDDIDFFFIVSPGSLWISRFFAVTVTELLGKRRRRKETNVKNTICLNMFMSESQLSVPTKEHDLYIAHEVLQMRPLWDRGGVHRKFLLANPWIKRFLPNAWKERTRFKNYDVRIQNTQENFFQLTTSIMKLFEPIAKFAQLQYMKNHRTTEVIGDSVLRFHPKDARVWVKKELAVRLKRYNVPLDKIFYAR